MSIIATAPVPAHSRFFDATTVQLHPDSETATVLPADGGTLFIAARSEKGAVSLVAQATLGAPATLLFTPADWARLTEVIDQAHDLAASDPRLHTRPVTTNVDIPADVRAEWDAELHPHWCAGNYGCGSHVSEYVYAPATADGFEPCDHGVIYPAVAVAASMSETGDRGVSLSFAPGDFEIVLSLPAARQLADAGDAARTKVSR